VASVSAAATTSKEFGEIQPCKPVIYAAVGLSAVYLLGRIRALVGGSERVPSAV
jgi:uncharacterized membrane protein YuzA (DUF378 family)